MINGVCPDKLKDSFVTRSQISGYPSRNQLDIDISRLNLESSKRSFFYAGAKTWNEIPVHIRMRLTILKIFLHC